MMKDKYFDPLLKTIEAGFSSLKDQEEGIEKQPEAMHEGMRQNIELKARNLEVMKLLLTGQISDL